MKPFYFFLLCVCSSLSLQAQEFRIHGTLRSQEMYISKVDVANDRTKKHVTTDANGYFEMDVALDDVLYLIHPDFELQKIIIVSSTTWLYEVELIPKAIQLEEVDVTQLKNVKVKVDPGETKLEAIKDAEFERYTGVYNGSMPLGMDFVGLFKKLGGLFKKKPVETTETAAPSVTDFIESRFTEDYWESTIHIKPEQKTAFLNYCLQDPKIKSILSREDGLELTEFFLQKKKEFDSQAVIIAPKP
ncbi:MAG: hypothetical protein RLZZ500_2033 [Bacteroidota bacterium]|jgi:hypothetical protein